MNKKGFTLVELLAVITILAVIALISVPTIANTIRESREDSYLEQERSIVNAAKTYMANHSVDLPAQTSGASKCITVKQLQQEGLLSSKNATSTSSGIKNPIYQIKNSTKINPKEKRQDFNGGVRVKWETSKYTYTYVQSCS